MVFLSNFVKANRALRCMLENTAAIAGEMLIHVAGHLKQQSKLTAELVLENMFFNVHFHVDGSSVECNTIDYNINMSFEIAVLSAKLFFHDLELQVISWSSTHHNTSYLCTVSDFVSSPGPSRHIVHAIDVAPVKILLTNRIWACFL